jgi:PiT family inorganic phosphate transporter
VIVPAILSPILAGLIAAVGVFLVYRIIRRFVEEGAEREFRWAQVGSSSMVALAHGTNDAQKTMGVICLALIANGKSQGRRGLLRPHVGRRLLRDRHRARDVHRRLADHQDARHEGRRGAPPQGFGSEAVAATVILVSSNAGHPLSTTQVVSGAVTGSGVGRPGAPVNWAVAGRIVIGWALTLPAAATTGGIVYAVIKLCGEDSAVGPIVTGAALAIGCFLLWQANRRQEVAPDETISEHPVFGDRAATATPVAV